MQTRSAVAFDGGHDARSTPARAAGWPAAAAVALAWFGLVLPLVGRTEWEDDMEHLTVATALMHPPRLVGDQAGQQVRAVEVRGGARVDDGAGGDQAFGCRSRRRV